jgi:glycosyltransferase involved in cell wall biosynthesis
MMAYELRKRGHNVLINNITHDCDFIFSADFYSVHKWEEKNNKFKLPVVEWCWDLPKWRTTWRLSEEEIKANEWRDEFISTNVERMKKAALVMCGSKWVQDDLKETYNIEAVHMYFYIGTAILNSVKQPKKENTVIQISRLSAPNKRFEDTIEAMSQIKDYNLVIVGKDEIRFLNRIGLDKYFVGPGKKRLLNIARTLGMINISVKSNLSDTERVRALKKAKLLVSPQSEDGWGMTVLEAIYCGIPVVTSNIRNYKDMYGTWVKYCELFNPNDLAEKIKFMLNNPNFCKEQINALQPFTQTLTVERATDRGSVKYFV